MRSGRGRAAWPESPSRSRRTTRRSAPSCSSGPGFAQEVSAASDSGEADAADAAGEPHHRRSDPRDLQPVAGTAAGDAARGHRGAAVVRSSEEQPDGSAARATSRAPSVIRPRARSASCRRRSGVTPPTTPAIDTPDGLYCKLPQDSPIAVRGARNYPCMGHPGKRAPTVELCDDPRGYQPLAMREHAIGPYPFDPNLIAQGVPPDDRVDFNDRIFAPIEGTPLPPGAVPGGNAAGSAGSHGTAHRRRRRRCRRRRRVIRSMGCRYRRSRLRSRRQRATCRRCRRARFRDLYRHRRRMAEQCPRRQVRSPARVLADRQSPSRRYDPRTGRYVTPDGQVQQLTNVASGAEPKSWKDLLPI